MAIVKWAVAAGVLLAACAPGVPEGEGARTRAADRSASLRLSNPRAVHASVPLGGDRLLIVGGCAARSCDPGPGSATADLVDARTGALLATGRLSAPRIGAAAVALAGDRVLIVGG